MTNNNKISSRQKVGFGVVVVGFAGILYGSTLSYHKNLSLINAETAIKQEINSTLDKKLMVQDTNILNNYSRFKDDYVKSLENKLQEIRAIPEYETQKRERQKETDSVPLKSAALLSGVFLYLAGLYIYSSKPKSSGASQ